MLPTDERVYVQKPLEGDTQTMFVLIYGSIVAYSKRGIRGTTQTIHTGC